MKHRLVPALVPLVVLGLLLVFPSCCTGCRTVETDPAKITTTVGQWEPPMLETLEQLQAYRPDLAGRAEYYINLFSDELDAEFQVVELEGLVPLLLAYIAEVDQDDTLTSDEKDLLVAIPNIWLEAIRNFLND